MEVKPKGVQLQNICFEKSEGHKDLENYICKNKWCILAMNCNASFKKVTYLLNFEKKAYFR